MSDQDKEMSHSGLWRFMTTQYCHK